MDVARDCFACDKKARKEFRGKAMVLESGRKQEKLLSVYKETVTVGLQKVGSR